MSTPTENPAKVDIGCKQVWIITTLFLNFFICWI